MSNDIHFEKYNPRCLTFSKFETNLSGRFESRTIMIEVLKSKSIFLKNMEGSIIPTIISHGEEEWQIILEQSCIKIFQHVSKIILIHTPPIQMAQ